MPAPILELVDISKSFPGVRALDGVSFDEAAESASFFQGVQAIQYA